MSISKPNRYSRDSDHKKFGIKNWLISKGLCMQSHNVMDQEQMEELLKEFWLFKENEIGFRYERKPMFFVNYANKNFADFCNFCVQHFYKDRFIKNK